MTRKDHQIKCHHHNKQHIKRKCHIMKGPYGKTALLAFIGLLCLILSIETAEGRFNLFHIHTPSIHSGLKIWKQCPILDRPKLLLMFLKSLESLFGNFFFSIGMALTLVQLYFFISTHLSTYLRGKNNRTYILCYCTILQFS